MEITDDKPYQQHYFPEGDVNAGRVNRVENAKDLADLEDARRDAINRRGEGNSNTFAAAVLDGAAEDLEKKWHREDEARGLSPEQKAMIEKINLLAEKLPHAFKIIDDHGEKLLLVDGLTFADKNIQTIISRNGIFQVYASDKRAQTIGPSFLTIDFVVVSDSMEKNYSEGRVMIDGAILSDQGIYEVPQVFAGRLKIGSDGYETEEHFVGRLKEIEELNYNKEQKRSVSPLSGLAGLL